MSRKGVPSNAIIVRTFNELRDLITAFADDKLNLLGIISNPGLSKTELVKAIMGTRRRLHVQGHATAFAIFPALYEYAGAPVILDDVNTLYNDPRTRPLLIQLCETVASKKVAWTTGAKLPSGTPHEFVMSSKVIILANEFRASNKNLEAILNRGLWVYFDPTAQEVHRYVGPWFAGQSPIHAEVYDFIGQRLFLISSPSIRMYMTALDIRKAMDKWKDYVLNLLCPKLDRKALEIAHAIYHDQSIPLKMAKGDKFIELTGLCRATYYNYIAIIEDNGGTLPSDWAA